MDICKIGQFSGSEEAFCQIRQDGSLFGKFVGWYPNYEEPNRIQISCAAFNGCAYSAEEVRDAIASKFGISMSYTTKPHRRYGADGYCGEGKAGDKICVLGTNKNNTAVLLLKAKLGAGKMNF